MFKNRIDFLIKERGLTGKFLASKCEVSEQTFTSWRRNKTQPDLISAYTLSKLLRIEMEDLLEEKDNKEE
ncbi:helix-turn-helix transcriptional regulator [Salipaludibacillus sp. CF4.18]|uniref:helix-turn-helix transcriptional regulator n=1 Tax=Salipaludibacillus sp. CF4.18 TaxID=3373081 RepID=UPI003EE5F158